MTQYIDGNHYDNATCWKCGCRWYMPHALYNSATQENRGEQSIFCPNGHANVWRKGESEADKMRRERDLLKQQNTRLAEERAAAERDRLAAERKLTLHKKRASAGTCPCCKRTFSALANHMKRQHPQFVAEQGAKVVPIKGAAT